MTLDRFKSVNFTVDNLQNSNSFFFPLIVKITLRLKLERNQIENCYFFKIHLVRVQFAIYTYHLYLHRST